MFQSMKNLIKSSPASKRTAPKTRLHVEGLEDRKLMTAGITLGTDGVIRIEGYDNANYGEKVSVRTLTNSTLSVYDDQIQVTMTHAKSVTSETFDLWKPSGRRQFTPAVTHVSYTGLGGNDSFVNSSHVSVTADGGAGNDRLKGGAFNEVLIGGLGNDTLTAGLGNDKLSGGAGTDTLVESEDLGFTLSDSGTSWGDGSMDTFSGIEVADMTGGMSANVMNAGSFTGTVTLHGAGGNDALNGGTGPNFLYGDDGNDSIRGNAGIDKLYGGLGDDELIGMGGNDILEGEDGDDTIWAGAGADLIYGGKGSDVLYGEAGDDDIYAGRGKDYLHGGADNDYLDGGYDRKVDHLYGEAGTDTFLRYTWHDTDSLFVWEWEGHRDKIHDNVAGEQVYQVHV